MKRNTAHPFVALIAALAALLLAGAPANAHVGSPDVFYEGDAGPYHLFVTVKVPQVIPGVADVEIRSNSDDVRSISTTVARLTGPGSKYIPVPDAAKRSTVDPRFFTSSLWLMEYGSLQVLLNVNGARGAAQMSVPVPSFARAVLPMPTWLGAILLALTIGLALGAISIVGAAAREAKLEPGAPVPQRSRTSGRIAMAVMAVIVGAVFYLAFAWWNADAAAYAAITRFFKAPRLAVTLDGTRLVTRPVDETWLKYEKVDELVPDHGHIVHLFLVRTPGLDRLWHLHPEVKNGEFITELPSIDAGHYKVFADVVDKSGFPWTLVGTIDLPAISGRPLIGDDSEGTAPAVQGAPESTSATLPDGTRVTWGRDSSALKPNVPTFLGAGPRAVHGDGGARRDSPRRPQRVRTYPSVGIDPDGVADDGERRFQRLIDGGDGNAGREDRARDLDPVRIPAGGALPRLPAVQTRGQDRNRGLRYRSEMKNGRRSDPAPASIRSRIAFSPSASVRS
jgi:hypothetical protein